MGEVDLAVTHFDDQVSMLYGRCLHRGALMADGHVGGDNLICGVHYWSYRIDTGVGEDNSAEALQRFTSRIDDDQVWIDRREINTLAIEYSQPYQSDAYLGQYQEPTGTVVELAGVRYAGT